MTKEDYMKLSKERLAELLAERDSYSPFVMPNQDIKQLVSIPSNPMQCWFPDGTCMNPFRDCINCPRPYSNGNKIYTSTTTSIKPNEVMYDGNPINNQEKKD